jgi:uncharacterized protein (TIGR02284 family)
VEDQILKEQFIRLADSHYTTMNRVDALVQEKDSSRTHDAPSETFVGTSSRIFGELLAKVSSNPDATLVKRLQEAEVRCLESIQLAIKNNDITESSRTVLKEELKNIQKTHEHMKQLKDKIAA